MLVSIGYSACHWCHVMERESFEDPDTAAIMNREFINIKIDREERPDLDQIYMDAVQAIAGNGGWPLNVFLTPEGKPFYGGTYFPPVNLHNRPSWKSVLQSIASSFRDRRAEIDQQADHLTNHIAGSSFGLSENAGDGVVNPDLLRLVFEQLMKTADRVEGGFGGSPKFPQTFSIRFLLQYFYFTGSREALDQAVLSLDKMIQGGIYDQLGGGFARYSTDREWLAPHFEKMLYDNSLLVMALSEAFQLTGKDIYRETIRETLNFIQNELSSPQGGFYSALDADSEGEEGKFYTWEKKEISEILGQDAEEFCKMYDVSEEGNWEGKNILRLTLNAQRLTPNAERLTPNAERLTPEPAHASVKDKRFTINGLDLGVARMKLLKYRNRRIRPQLDDKILLGWNALQITAYCKAFAAIGEESYRVAALKAIHFLEEKMKGEGIFKFYHTYKDKCGSMGVWEYGSGWGKASIPAFLDDYAYLIEAYIQLQEVTGDGSYLIRAKELSDWVVAHFSEEETGFFYYTHADQDDVIVRKREVYDGATPSGNSVMATNLLYLGTVFDSSAWKQRAAGNAGSMIEITKRYPGSFGVWATLLNGLTYPLYEIVLSGDSDDQKHREFLAKGIPNRVFQLTSVTPLEFPILRNKPVQGPSRFFLCRDYACQQPVKEVSELAGLIKNS